MRDFRPTWPSGRARAARGVNACRCASKTSRSTRTAASCAGPATLVAVEPQVFDLIDYLVRRRERVVTKDELLDEIWGGRAVSELTLTSRINAARRALGDSGDEQRLVRTIARKGFRFVGTVQDVGSTRTVATAAAIAGAAGLAGARPARQSRCCRSPT